MHVIARPCLIGFWMKHPDAEGPLRAWYAEAKAAEWSSSADIKKRYSTASILNSERVVFNIGGNKYRLVVRINYASGTVFVGFVGTHKDYDSIDAEAV